MSAEEFILPLYVFLQKPFLLEQETYMFIWQKKAILFPLALRHSLCYFQAIWLLLAGTTFPPMQMSPLNYWEPIVSSGSPFHLQASSPDLLLLHTRDAITKFDN
ncbi:uncharacterized protein LOC144582182 isoform X2 [Callithrix jacchus]